MERTSALMYFLSLNALAKRLGETIIDLSPDTMQGQHRRRLLCIEFDKLARLAPGVAGELRQVTVLGKVDVGGTEPEKRISSNFLTVPVKKASLASDQFDYPRRPSPVIQMGKISTGHSWGVQAHTDWQLNLPKLLSEVSSNTPFTDLGVFVSRSTSFEESDCSVCDALLAALTNRFTRSLADYWVRRIEFEKAFFSSNGPLFASSYTDAFNSHEASSEELNPLHKLSKSELLDRIRYLEGILDGAELKY